MAGLEMSILSPQIGENLFPPHIVQGHVWTPIYEIDYFWIYRVVWQFRENRPKDVEKSVDGKKEITRPKYNSLRLSLRRYAGDCNNSLLSGDKATPTTIPQINDRQPMTSYSRLCVCVFMVLFFLVSEILTTYFFSSSRTSRPLLMAILRPLLMATLRPRWPIGSTFSTRCVSYGRPKQ